MSSGLADHAGAHFLAEQPLQQVFVQRQRVLREDRIAELLELIQDLVIQAGIVVIGPAQHDDADAVFALQLIEHLRARAGGCWLRNLSAPRIPTSTARSFSSSDRPRIGCHACSIWCANSLRSAKLRTGSIYFTLCSAKTSFSLVNAAFTVSGVAVTVGQAFAPTIFTSGEVQHVVHREEDRVQRLLAMLLLNQVVDVRNADLGREAGIDRAAARARAIQLGTGVVGVNDVFRLHAQAFEVGVEQRSVGVDVQHARNADAELLAILHQRDALFGRLCSSQPSLAGQRIGHALGVDRPEDFVRRDIDEVRMLVANLVEPGLDVLHVVDIFDRALFAGGDDQALLAVHERNLGDFLNRHKAQVVLGLRCGCR